MMKIRIYIILIFAVLFSSCEDYVDISPDMGIEKEELFGNYNSYRGMVDYANSLVKNYAPNVDLHSTSAVPGHLSDECQHAGTSGKWHNRGDWSWSAGEMGFRVNKDGSRVENRRSTPTGMAVYGLRTANQCLANIDLLAVYPEESIYTDEQLKNQLIGQCYFLRAWFYFELIRRYGPMPRMNIVFSSDHNFDGSRPTYQQSTDWLVEDLESAITYLPEQWDAPNLGRVTVTSAKALKAMALLYAASPNMNHEYDSDDKSYNTAYLEKAVQASVEAIKSAEANAYTMIEFDRYGENWVSKTNRITSETIFGPTLLAKAQWVNACGKGWFLPPFDGGYGKFHIHPTQNAVEKFETIDGWDISDPNMPATSFDAANPYSNRDPRLTNLIFTNGENMYMNPGHKNPIFQPWHTFVSGQTNGYHYKYMIEDKSYADWTGYVLKGKHRWVGANNWDKNGPFYKYFPHIRLPQLYLDLAEAANELYGPLGAIPGAGAEWNNAELAVRKVRERVNMQPVRTEYLASTDVFRERIRNERFVELYMEQHRWHDIRRWRIAVDVLKEIRGISIEKKVDGSFVYSNRVINNARVFENQHYWYPFSTATEGMFTEFEQNPGW